MPVATTSAASAVPAGVGEAGGTATRAGVSGETTLAELDPAWIRYGPFTLSGFVAIGVVAGFGWRLMNEAGVDFGRVGPLRAIGEYLAGLPVPVAVAEVLLAVVAVVAIASTVGYLLAFWKFRLVRRDGGTLHVTRGLLTTRATTIEERRLRGVEISEPLLLRSVGGARCIAIATGLRVGHGAERGGSLLLPPAPRAEADRVAGEILGTTAPVTSPVVAHGRGARRRRYTRALAAAALVTAVLATVSWLAGWPAVVWQVSLVLWGLAALLAHDRYRGLGHAVAGHHLVIRTGSVVRRRYALSRDGVIGWNVHASFWQRRAGLVTLTATTAAGRQRYAVTDAPAATALAVADEITPGLLTPFLATH